MAGTKGDKPLSRRQFFLTLMLHKPYYKHKGNYAALVPEKEFFESLE
jgi:hypothetical protein